MSVAVSQTSGVPQTQEPCGLPATAYPEVPHFTVRAFARAAHIQTATAEEFLHDFAETGVAEKVDDDLWVLTEHGADIAALLNEVGEDPGGASMRGDRAGEER